MPLICAHGNLFEIGLIVFLARRGPSDSDAVDFDKFSVTRGPDECRARSGMLQRYLNWQDCASGIMVGVTVLARFPIAISTTIRQLP